MNVEMMFNERLVFKPHNTTSGPHIRVNSTTNLVFYYRKGKHCFSYANTQVFKWVRYISLQGFG